MNVFETTLQVEALPSELENILKAVENIKNILITNLSSSCSSEEHTYVCGTSKSLVKVLPAEIKSGTTIPYQQPLLIIRIQSTDPVELVRLTDLISSEFKSAGIRYRRIE